MHPINVMSTSPHVEKIFFSDKIITTKTLVNVGILGANPAGEHADVYISQLTGSASTFCTFLGHEDHLQHFLKTCDVIFCLTVDFDKRHYDFVKEHDNHKIHWCLPGEVDFQTHNPIIFYPEWWHATNRNYHGNELVNDLSLLHRKKTVKNWFISLLGIQSFHKDSLYSVLCNLKKKLPGYICYDHKDSDNYLEMTGINRIRTTDHLPGNIIKYKDAVSLSSLFIPLEYEHYTLDVFTESKFDQQYVFTTERIAKCLLAKKPWLGLMPSTYLEFYKNLGFKLDSQIDYSYVTTEDYNIQANLLANELYRLYVSGYVPDQSVLDHNFKLFYDTDWRQRMCSKVAKVITSFDS